jgi:DNA-binding NarL/FixJ family response regulator
MEKLRLLLTDDHPLFRKGLFALLSTHSNLEIVGAVSTGEDAFELIPSVKPNVVLMDLQMPGSGGIATTRRIRYHYPDVKVLVITLFKDDDSIFMALRAGANGYILKNADEEEMLRAITAVGNGEVIFSSEIASRVLHFFSGKKMLEVKNIFPFLTDRERDILYLIAKGQSNNEIASELFLSPKTIGNYASVIYHKLQVADRAEAMAKARDAGLLKNNE